MGAAFDGRLYAPGSLLRRLKGLLTSPTPRCTSLQPNDDAFAAHGNAAAADSTDVAMHIPKRR